MKSDKTVLNILEDFLDEHAGESAWEDAEKALNAHYLTIAERLIGTISLSNLERTQLRTAFRKEYGGEE